VIVAERAVATDRSAARRVRRESRVRLAEHVVYRDFPTQTVVLNLRTGRYHGLNPTAGRMMATLERAPSIAEAGRLVAEHYGQPRGEVEQHLCELCAELLERGLVDLEDDTDG
jgi:Coenzyme PQQ synthesis protein D (PqqD)